MADGREMRLIASTFKRTARMRRIRTLLSSSNRAAGNPDWSDKASDLCTSMAGQTVNISVSCCSEGDWCGDHWCHRRTVSGLGFIGDISPHRPGLSSHMLCRCVCACVCVCLCACVSTFIHFNLSNTTLTEGAIHYFAAFHLTHTHTYTLPQQRSEQKELSRCLNFVSRCCVCLCLRTCAHMHACVLDRLQDQEKKSTIWRETQRMCRLRSHHMLKIQPAIWKVFHLQRYCCGS